MRNALIALVGLIGLLSLNTSAQNIEIWKLDGSGTPVLLTGNDVTVGANTQLRIKVKGVGLPNGTNSSRRYECYWDMGNCKDYRLSSNQTIDYHVLNGRIKPRVVLKGVYSDEDLRVVQSSTEITIGNGQVGSDMVDMDNSKWVEIEQVNDLRNNRLVSYYLKYSNRYNPGSPDSGPGTTTDSATDREQNPVDDVQTDVGQSSGDLDLVVPNSVFDRFDFPDFNNNLTNLARPIQIDRAAVARALAPSNQRSVAEDNDLSQAIAARTNTSASSFNFTFRYPKDKLEFYGINRKDPADPMLLTVGGSLCQLISLDTTSSGDTGIISIEAVPVSLNEERQILLTFLTKPGQSANTPVKVISTFDIPEAALDLLDMDSPPEDEHTGVVTTSHDPNAKTVYPAKFCKPTAHQYTIYFENEGFASAGRIWIVDSIDPRLDFLSINQFEASAFGHLSEDSAYQPTDARTANITIGAKFAPPDPVVNFPMTSGKGLHIYKDESSRKIVWVFDQIDLPGTTDSLANNLGSVTYSIGFGPGAELAEGTKIYTPASIVFDSNDPVSTLDEDRYTDTAVWKRIATQPYPGTYG